MAFHVVYIISLSTGVEGAFYIMQELYSSIIFDIDPRPNQNESIRKSHK
jgi:hypothetical protein